MSSGGGTQTTNSGIPAQYQPYLDGILNAGSQIANTPYQAYNGPQVAPLNNVQSGAIGGIQNMMYGTPGTQAAQNFNTNMINGGGFNPYTSQAAQAANDQVTQAYNAATQNTRSQMINAGIDGSSSQGQQQGVNDRNFSQGLAQATMPLYLQQYNTQIGQQQQAANNAFNYQNSGIQALMQGLQAGGVAQGTQQNQLSSLYNNFQQARQYPQNQLSNYVGMIGSLLGGQRQQTTQLPSANTAATGLGGAALLGAGLNSYGRKGG